MSSIKADFPDEQALKEEFQIRWEEDFHQHFDDLSYKREAVSSYQKRALASFLGLLGVVALAFGTEDMFRIGDTLIVMVAIAIAIPLILYFGFSVYELIRARFDYALSVNKRLYPHLYSIFGLEVEYHSGIDDAGSFSLATSRRYGSEDEQHNEIIADLKQSELLTETVEHDVVDDVIKTTFAGRPLTVSEIKSTRVEGSGKHKRTVTVFSGMFVSYELPQILTGVTFISTEGDESGYGHRDFWSRVTGKTAVEETELEWNTFERDLHVATSDGTEARYILTPDFMEDLHAWWQTHTKNIRLVFRGNKFYTLFPDKGLQIADVTMSVSEAKQREYAFSVLRPLWHNLRLLEDVNDRFRY